MPGEYALLVPGTFLLAAGGTRLVRALARRLGIVAAPRPDRWHARPTALLGGVAMAAAMLPSVCCTGPHSLQAWTLFAGCGCMFAVGLCDDLRPWKPYQKLAAQVSVGGWLAASGALLPWTHCMPVDLLITIVWLVGITNALNLLDNMDGLAAGIAAIAAGCLAVMFFTEQRPAEALLLASLAAATLGFLCYNTQPASIFMGDCGSMFLGFFLAGAALLSVSGGRSRALLPVVAVPVLILLLPIADTLLVTVARRLAGRSIAQGGRDHASHRLVALGIPERQAVWLLYAVAAASGLLGLLVSRWPVDLAVAAIAAFVVALVLLALGVAWFIRGDRPPPAAADAPVGAFLLRLSHRRRIFEVLLDAVLILLAHYTALGVLYGPIGENALRSDFLRAAPVLLSVRLAAFLAAGVYRGVWRYISLDDFLRYARAIVLGSGMSAATLWLLGEAAEGSRALVVLDALLLLLGMTASRLSFRVVAYLLGRSAARSAPRTVIYGADDTGELLLQVLRQRHAAGYRPVAFLDPDPRKAGRIIHRLPVLACGGRLADVLRGVQAQRVVLSAAAVGPQRLCEILDCCRALGVPVWCVRIELLPMELSGQERALPVPATEIGRAESLQGA